MKLLTTIPVSELPGEALLARLRCRRAAISLEPGREAEAPVTAGEYWVFQHLNRRMRRRLEPLLELFAMRSLVLGLRYVLVGEAPPGGSMQRTLLAEPFWRLIGSNEDDDVLVARLEKLLSADYPFAVGLTTAYRRQGPGGVELQLTEGILRHGLNRSCRGIVRDTLRYLVDMRNCLTINKFWQWQVSRRPALTAGGTLSINDLQRVWTAQDGTRLAAQVRRLAGAEPSSGRPAAMEQCLLEGLTRLLHRAGRDPLGHGVVIEYLWRVRLARHNRLLQSILTEGREALFEEVLLV